MRIIDLLRRLRDRRFGRGTHRRGVADAGFAPPRPADRAALKLAQRNARSMYQGPPEGEPHVGHHLQALGSHLTRLFRTDEELRSAQGAVVDAGHALADATNELPRVLARTEDALHHGAGVPPIVADPAEAARWTASARALTERRAAEEAVVVARQADVSATRHLQTVESRAIDRLAEAAAAGLVPINAYLAAFDQARAGLARQGIGLLGEEMVHDLVRRAVRPIDLHAAGDEAA